jgi:myosin heavy subunit
MLLPKVSIPNYISSWCLCSAVEQFFNKKRDRKTGNGVHLETNKMSKDITKIKTKTSENIKHEVKIKTAPSDILRCKVEGKASEIVSPKTLLDSSPFKKRKVFEEKSSLGHSSNSQMKKEFNEKKELRQDHSYNPIRKVTEVTERPNAVSL